jgi:precorrin-6A synthase
MKTVLIIGIGAGDPEQLTVQAINALSRVDVFFLLEKGPAKQALVAFRKAVCERYVSDRAYRVVEAESPARERRPADYGACVAALNRDKQAVFERLIAGEMADGETGCILAWGDPSLYDSSIRNIEAVAARQPGIAFEVVPGISSVQALAAKHRIPLNAVGGAVEITTGRRLRARFPDADSVVVMLDSAEDEAFNAYVDQDLEIYWGAYLGTPDEMLIAGPLKQVAAEISRAKREARARHGWIFDIYLLRRRPAKG